jgi:hypothetical protein
MKSRLFLVFREATTKTCPGSVQALIPMESRETNVLAMEQV